MTLLLPDQRETCCHTWHGTRAVTLLCNASSLRHKAPGSLSRTANLQEASVSPGSAQRRVVPWGDVSSWVKRNRMNLLSDDVRSLIFQYRINPRAQFSRHRH